MHFQSILFFYYWYWYISLHFSFHLPACTSASGGSLEGVTACNLFNSFCISINRPELLPTWGKETRNIGEFGYCRVRPLLNSSLASQGLLHEAPASRKTWLKHSIHYQIKNTLIPSYELWWTLFLFSFSFLCPFTKWEIPIGLLSIENNHFYNNRRWTYMKKTGT